MLIFNFHHVEPSLSNPYRKWITITPAGLRNFIGFMRRHGFQPVSLKDFIEYGGDKSGDLRQFIITFDDGYENFYRYAAPVLIEEQCPATVFIIAEKIGKFNDWDKSSGDPDNLMTFEQIKELSDSGYITFGSHGLKHVRFSKLSQSLLIEEIEKSYRILSKSFPESFVPVLAYPWGDYSSETLKVMSQSSYLYALSTNKGKWNKNSSKYIVPRYSVYHRDASTWWLFAKLLINGILPVSAMPVISTLPLIRERWRIDLRIGKKISHNTSYSFPGSLLK